MKNTIVFMLLFLVASQACAQSINDGKLMFQYSRYVSAEKVFNKIITANPSSADGWYWLVKSSIAEDSFAKAKKYAAAIPESIKDEPYVKIAKGAVSLYAGDSLAAKQYFNEALGDKRKKDPFVQMAIAQAYNDTKNSNHNEAVQLLLAANKRESKNAEILTSLGDAYRWLYDGSSAYRSYEEAIDANSNYADAFFKMGKIFQTQNNAEMFVNYYQKAVDADSNYAPAYYELFYYHYNKNAIQQAFGYLKKYIAHSEPRINNEYLVADMLLATKNYGEAIVQSEKIISMEKMPKPTIYRLMAYASMEMGNISASEAYLNKYFSQQPDSNKIAKDYELMASIYEKTNRDSLAMTIYQKAFLVQKDSSIKLRYATNLASSYKKKKDYQNEAIWDEQVYRLKQNATNVDIYNWGIASYYSKDYETADSVFALYQEKYPKQVYGYYWRARSNEAIDTAMATGIAVPHYLEMIDVAVTDTANATNKRWLIQAYTYVAAYKANTEKNYEEAIDYFAKVLELSPENEQIIKYKEMLEKRIARDKNAVQNNQEPKTN